MDERGGGSVACSYRFCCMTSPRELRTCVMMAVHARNVPTAHQFSIRCSAPRSANAAIVNDGFGPTGPGMIEPSAMCRSG